MTNIFEMLKNYKDDSKDHTYASISDPQLALRESLSNAEFILYNQIKQSDKARLIKSGQIQENGH
jgi:hypothetical protein